MCLSGYLKGEGMQYVLECQQFQFSDKLPLLPILIISPSLFGLVGSPTIQKSIFSFFF